MGEDISKAIQSIMAGAQNAPQPPRDLAPYLMTANELIRANIPPKRFLVSTFLPSSSFGMVFAQRGIGKSWFAMGLAKALATGEDTFLGWKIHEKGHVLFIDGEMSLVDCKLRVTNLFGETGSPNFHLVPSENLYLNGCPICLDMPQEHQAILNLLSSMEASGRKPKLIVLDNLSTLRRGVNENDNSETQSLLDFLVKLRHLGYAVLVVHHTNKAGEQRGASILEVPMDYIIKLSPPDKSDAAFKSGACFNVEFTKVRNRMPSNREFLCELVEMQDGTVEFVVNTNFIEVPKGITLLRAIADGVIKPSVRVFSKRLGWSVGTIDKQLKVLREDRAIEQNSYLLTDKGRCILHEYFPQIFTKPKDFKDYQSEIPF
jgi:hypothetical protein